jgi:hypothetical protein
MGNLRDYIDGVSSLEHNLTPDRVDNSFKVQQDVVVRRQTNRSGPSNTEIMVGTILALGDTSAKVAIKKGGGRTETKDILLKDLSPVSLAFKRSSIQFQPAYRGRV